MAVELYADFETGNGELVAVDGDCLRFRALSKRGARIMWWHIELRGIAGRELMMVLDNAAEVLGGLESCRAVMPVVSYEPGRAARLRRVCEPGHEGLRQGGRGLMRGAGVQHCANAKAWHRLPRGEIDEATGTWRFRCAFPKEADTVRLAFCYPYGYTRAWHIARGWERAGAQVEVLCKSPGGRDVPILMWGDPDGPRRELVVAVARQHAGESPGSFVLEGFVEPFIGGGDCAKWLRQRGLLLVIPALDVDGVAEGGYGKGQAPVDMMNDWEGDSKWPQVRAVRQIISELAERHRYTLFLDFHAPLAHQGNYICLAQEDAVPEAAKIGQRRFVELLDRHQSAWFDFHPEDCYVCVLEREAAFMAQAREHGCTGLCIETTYHVTRDGRVGSPLRYRQHGQAIAAAAVAFIREGEGS
jgi:hypothetical protein